ncbi:hypothetical protein MKX08_006250 [Trichoderma sp. CBMAI-0020]|nr:hypothetical protein MKX08_006250 [Trichoderma sp. CBMAI-0020]
MGDSVQELSTGAVDGSDVSHTLSAGASDARSDVSCTLSAEVSNAGGDISHTDMHPDVHKASGTMRQWEWWFKRRANDGTGDPHAGGGDLSAGDGNPSTVDGNPSTVDGNPSTVDGEASTGYGDPSIEDGDPAPGSDLEFDYMFGYPTTTEQMQEYWRMMGWSANETLRLDKYYLLEKALSSAELPRGVQETWLMFDPGSRNVVYTGASIYHRKGLVSTTKGGAKLVRATIVSQIVTDFGHRSCGLATHFLNLLAEQMDGREGEEHIAFSVLYSGPKTDLFQRCGWRPLPAKQLRIVLGDLQYDQLRKNYFDRYPKYAQYTKYLFWENLVDWHGESNGLSMMAMSAVKQPTAHAQIVLLNDFTRWHLRRASLRQTISSEHQQAHSDEGPVPVGASFFDVKSNTTISAFWVREYVKRRLYVGYMDVRRRNEMEGGIRTVLSMAVKAACEYGLREVILWDPSAQIVEQAQRLAAEIGHGVTATWEHRSEMIPCFRWHGGESKEVTWTESGYFGSA